MAYFKKNEIPLFHFTLVYDLITNFNSVIIKLIILYGQVL